MAIIPGVSGLPTDNLYKFIAIAGLVGVVAIETLRTISYNKTFEGYVVVDADFQNLLRQHRQTLEAFEQKRITREAFLVRVRGLDSLGASMRERHTQVESMRELEAERREHLRDFSYISVVFMSFGFSAWYFLVQRYQDAILRADARRVGYMPDQSTTARRRPRRLWRRVKRILSPKARP